MEEMPFMVAVRVGENIRMGHMSMQCLVKFVSPTTMSDQSSCGCSQGHESSDHNVVCCKKYKTCVMQSSILVSLCLKTLENFNKQ